MDLSVANLDDCSNEDREELRRVFVILGSYCTYKNNAVNARQQGNIMAATLWESECERLYSALPTNAKW